MAAPDLVSLAPAAGSQGTTFAVVLSGDDFDCTLSPGTVPSVSFGTNVTVNSVTCPGTTVSENSLTANVTLNAGAGVGAHDVSVSNPDMASDTLTGSFEFFDNRHRMPSKVWPADIADKSKIRAEKTIEHQIADGLMRLIMA